MNKENVVHLHSGVLLSSKKYSDILKFACKWMELGKKNNLSEVTQTQIDKHGTFSLVSGY